ncbi:MAG: hypothetical protein LBB66_04370 [Desulfovibrio sp.]|jgi:hypothetical protein|nr:hypothetical protein [Desulfovibrio sp.]
MKKKTKKRAGRSQGNTPAKDDTYLQLDRISGSKDPEVEKYYDKVYEEEFAKYFDWLDAHSTPDGRNLRDDVPGGESARQHKMAMDRVHARVGHRFIHLLSPLMQQRFREDFPIPPDENAV